MENKYQIIVALFLAIRFVALVKLDFHGRKASQPTGFSGFITTLVAFLVVCYIYWKAGAFSTLFH